MLCGTNSPSTRTISETAQAQVQSLRRRQIRRAAPQIQALTQMAKAGAKALQKTTLTNEKLTIRQLFEFRRMEAATKREKGHVLGEYFID